MTIGIRIQRYLKELGLTQQTLTEPFNQEPSNISLNMVLQSCACLPSSTLQVRNAMSVSEKSDIHGVSDYLGCCAPQVQMILYSFNSFSISVSLILLRAFSRATF